MLYSGRSPLMSGVARRVGQGGAAPQSPNVAAPSWSLGTLQGTEGDRRRRVERKRECEREGEKERERERKRERERES